MARSSTRLLATAALTCAALVPAAFASPASATAGPQQNSFVGAITASLTGQSKSDPPGANDWNCKPTAAHPRPVVLVHGTWENAYDNWAYISPKLKADGLCVFALNYSTNTPAAALGLNGAGPIAASANELATYVDKVLAATGAKQVDIVGHSQGGMMPRQYLKFDGGANPANPSQNKVLNMVSLNATNNGTTLDGIATLGYELNVMAGVRVVTGDAAIDQTTGSAFMKNLNAGGMTLPGIRYTAIATKYDEVTTPYTSAYITNNLAGAYVANISLQNGCGTNFAEHLSTPYSARTLWYVENALGVAKTASAPCDIQLPIF